MHAHQPAIKLCITHSHPIVSASVLTVGVVEADTLLPLVGDHGRDGSVSAMIANRCLTRREKAVCHIFVSRLHSPAISHMM